MKSFMLITAFFLAIACQSHASQQTSPQRQEIMGTGTVTAVESDDGKTLEIAKGVDIAIKLQSHSDGGYMWKLDNAGGLGQPTYKHDTSACAPNVIGCSGSEVFTFSTSSAIEGTYTVSLIEIRFGRDPGTKYVVTFHIK